MSSRSMVPIIESAHYSELDYNLDTLDDHNVVLEIVRSSQKNTGSVYALLNFFKGNIGTGILSIPIAFKYSGLWIGMFCITFFGIIATYSMHILSRVSESVTEKHDLDMLKMDYSETVFEVVKHGPTCLQKYKGKFKHFSNVFLILTQVGVCCVYLLFISQNIEYFIEVIVPGRLASIYLIGFIVSLCLIILCQIRNMRIFAPLSALAIAATITGLVLIFIYLFTTGLKDTDSLPTYTSLRSSLIGFGIFAFAFEGISLCLPIRNRMIYPNQFTSSNGVLNTVMVTVVCLCALMGFFGYLRFGQDTLGSITYNIPNVPIVYAFVKPLFIIAIFISYSLQFYIPASIFARLLQKFRFYHESNDRRQSIIRKIMRTGVVLFTYVIAMAVPHLDLMISLIGAISNSFLVLIIPPILELIHLWPERELIQRFWLNVFLKHILLIAVGVCAMVGGTTSTVIQIIQTNTR